MRKLRLNNNQKAFTIVELLIASTVFAVVLILMTIAMIQIGRTYYKGITTTRTQDVTREIMDDVSRQIQFGGSTPDRLTRQGPNRGYCIGNMRYSYTLDRQITESSPHALVVDEITCGGGTRPQSVVPGTSVNGRELLGGRMRLRTFDINQIGTSNLYRITVKVISGDNDVLTSNHQACRLNQSGSQFCAVSELSTVVQKRL